jgi:hypothetical protein
LDLKENTAANIVIVGMTIFETLPGLKDLIGESNKTAVR